LIVAAERRRTTTRCAGNVLLTCFYAVSELEEAGVLPEDGELKDVFDA
jgi:hypothetical protein